MGISHELSEEDVKFRYINEAITSKGWTKDSIFMEQQVKFTDGKISLHGNIVHREKPKFADYVLYVNKNTPTITKPFSHHFCILQISVMLKLAIAQIVSIAAMKLTAYKKLSFQSDLLYNFDNFIVIFLYPIQK